VIHHVASGYFGSRLRLTADYSGGKEPVLHSNYGPSAAKRAQDTRLLWPDPGHTIIGGPAEDAARSGMGRDGNCMAPQGRYRRRLIAAGLLLVMVIGPAAGWLQSPRDCADAQMAWDAVYLVAGARAQDRRIGTLTNWVVEIPPVRRPVILIGSDPQISYWCSRHQTNHTRTAWAVEKLCDALRGGEGGGLQQRAPEDVVLEADARMIVVPGQFSGTDGEMEALSEFLAVHPEMTRIALVTSRFHSRRAMQRARCHAPSRVFAVVPAPPHWEDRAPWIVAGEYAKLLRDALGLARAPGLARAAIAGSDLEARQ